MPEREYGLYCTLHKNPLRSQAANCVLQWAQKVPEKPVPPPQGYYFLDTHIDIFTCSALEGTSNTLLLGALPPKELRRLESLEQEERQFQEQLASTQTVPLEAHQPPSKARQTPAVVGASDPFVNMATSSCNPLFDGLPTDKSASTPNKNSCNSNKRVAERQDTSTLEEPVAKKLKPSPEVLHFTAVCHGDKGRRKTMEDAETICHDLHAEARRTVVPEGVSSSTPLSTITTGSTQSDLIDATNLWGLQRKAAVQFARSLKAQAQYLADEKNLAAPRIAFYGLFDGHAGSQAADFCQKWLHLFIYFELWSLVLPAPKDAATPKPKPSYFGAKPKPKPKGSSPSNTTTTTTSSNAAPPNAPKPTHCFAHIPPSEISKALIAAVEKTDQAFLEDAKANDWQDGCTVVGVLYLQHDQYCISVGDSKAIMAIPKKGAPADSNLLDEPQILSGKEHKPINPLESKRINNIKNCSVMQGRVNGILGVSRTIGDCALKRCGVISTPNVVKCPARAGLFVVVACDGLWDVYPRTSVLQFVKKRLDENDDPQKIVAQLVDDAINVRHSKDNVTVMMLVPKK